jgi:hypothetical protein
MKTQTKTESSTESTFPTVKAPIQLFFEFMQIKNNEKISIQLAFVWRMSGRM